MKYLELKRCTRCGEIKDTYSLETVRINFDIKETSIFDELSADTFFGNNKNKKKTKNKKYYFSSDEACFCQNCLDNIY